LIRSGIDLWSNSIRQTQYAKLYGFVPVNMTNC